MIETLLDFLYNSSDFRKEHNLGFIVRDENGKELCNSKETKTLEDWMNSPVINMVVTKSEETESDIIITVVDWNWNNEDETSKQSV